MDKTAEIIASETLEETLQRKNVSYGTTYPAILFRSKKSGQVLYLEAGNDFVDTLLRFLLLPLGTVIHFLSRSAWRTQSATPTGIQVTPAMGGILSFFESVKNFSSSDMKVAKELLMRPRPAAIGCSCKSSDLPMQLALETALILPSPLQMPELYYKCSGCNNLYLSSKCIVCMPCKSRGHTCQMIYSLGPYSLFSKIPDYYTSGFVSFNTTFIITDSLEIMPLTTIQSVSVLSKLKDASLADLEGNNITVSLRQGGD